jgi:hypothetical protein
MERRSLSTAMQTIPNADPDAVRQFVTQSDPSRPVLTEATPRRRIAVAEFDAPARSSAVAPIGLIPVTVRLRPELAGALKRASLERQLAGEEVFTQQDLVAEALDPWLRERGYFD